MALTNEDVQEILQLLDSSPYDELQLETDRFKLTLRRAGSGGWMQELQTRSRFIRVTSFGLKESHVHDVLVTKEAPNYRTEL